MESDQARALPQEPAVLSLRDAEVLRPAHQDSVFHCTRADEIEEAHRDGRIAWIASMEGAAMIENDLDRIDILYGLGVRPIRVTR